VLIDLDRPLDLTVARLDADGLQAEIGRGRMAAGRDNSMPARPSIAGIEGSEPVLRTRS
jgi:hypothetical protein